MTFQVRQHSIAGMCCLNGDIISLVKKHKIPQVSNKTVQHLYKKTNIVNKAVTA